MNSDYILEGDCIELMQQLIDEKLVVQSIVTDPPYHIGFMSNKWDKEGKSQIAFNPETWKLCYQLLPPGGHLAAFGSCRTYHRLACAIEDAGFEIREQLAWVTGQGMPKGQNPGKKILKELETQIRKLGINTIRWNEEYEVLTKYRIEVFETEFIVTQNQDGSFNIPENIQNMLSLGTDLKPSFEPIVLARKPLEKTVVHSVLTYGTGGLNIDACRVPVDKDIDDPRLGGQGTWNTKNMAKNVYSGGYKGETIGSSELGRWPTNLIHDGSEEVVSLFPLSKGQMGDVKGTENSEPGWSGGFERLEFKKRKPKLASAARFFSSTRDGEPTNDKTYSTEGSTNFKMKPGNRREAVAPSQYFNSFESESRMFYCAKASKKERGDSKHNTIKPVALMRWLVRLITPPGGIVLDPFAGSGTTGEAALLEGFFPILIEKESEYVEDIIHRLEKINTT